MTHTSYPYSVRSKVLRRSFGLWVTFSATARVDLLSFCAFDTGFRPHSVGVSVSIGDKWKRTVPPRSIWSIWSRRWSVVDSGSREIGGDGNPRRTNNILVDVLRRSEVLGRRRGGFDNGNVTEIDPHQSRGNDNDIIIVVPRRRVISSRPYDTTLCRETRAKIDITRNSRVSTTTGRVLPRPVRTKTTPRAGRRKKSHYDVFRPMNHNIIKSFIFFFLKHKIHTTRVRPSALAVENINQFYGHCFIHPCSMLPLRFFFLPTPGVRWWWRRVVFIGTCSPRRELFPFYFYCRHFITVFRFATSRVM